MKKTALLLMSTLAPLTAVLIACQSEEIEPPSQSDEFDYTSSSGNKSGSSSGRAGEDGGSSSGGNNNGGSSSGDNNNNGGSSSGDNESGSSSSGGNDNGSSSSGGNENGSSSGGGTTACADGEQPTHLRIVAGNITSGTQQSYDPGHGNRIFKGLNVDIALVQEMNYGNNDVNAMNSFVSEAFGNGYHWYREPRTNGVSIPNGIVSRYPIIASGAINDPEVSNRKFAWARIDVPGPRKLFAISVHFLTRSAGARNTEARALLSKIPEFMGTNDYLVLGGDFNTNSRTESALHTLRERFVVAAPYPSDEEGRTGTNANRSKPYDWVLASPALHALQVPTVYGNLSFINGLVFDSRSFSNLNLVPPVQRSDSGAPYMQHMAVVRDFELPCQP